MNIKPPIHIKEFFSAARKPYSYNVFQNIYILFGILWGVPIPIVTILMETYHLHAADTENIISIVLSSPLQLLFIAHPLFFGALFGILGTIRHEKDQELTSKIKELNNLTIHDSLTGLKNRRYFVHVFHDECARSLRRNEVLSLLFLDIDHFKNINDTFGHHIGDTVLKETGRYLKRQCRPYDTPVRWGGEEFLILLRATDEVAAVHFAERIRAGIEAGCSTDITTPFTLSIGLAEHSINDTLEQLTDRADQALYHAKQTGRNKVVCWSALQDFRKKEQ